MNLNTPEGRAAAIQALGPEAYNEAMKAHREANVVATMNGHKIRTVQTARFGTLYHVGATNSAFATLDEAKAFATETPS